MLSMIELQQLFTAIDMAQTINIAGYGEMISAHNVKVLLGKYVEQESVTANQEANDEPLPGAGR